MKSDIHMSMPCTTPVERLKEFSTNNLRNKDKRGFLASKEVW